MASSKNSRRKFLSRTMKILVGGLAFPGARGKAASGNPSSPRISWREAMHFAKSRKLAG